MNEENSKKQKPLSDDKNEEGKEEKSKTGKENMFTEWQDSSKMNSGNDIASEVKIANSGGTMEGGADKQWHGQESDLHSGNKADFEK